MNIDPQFKRRIRIVGEPGIAHGFTLWVLDADTGEPITNVRRIELVLDAGEQNVARVSYHEYDSSHRVVTDEQGEPVVSTLIVSDVEVDVTAYELAP